MVEDNGISLVYEKKLETHVNGKTIDYLTGHREGFTIFKNHLQAGSGGGGCC